MLLTGVQILLGFLLTLAFSAGFPGLDGFRHAVYVTALLAAVFLVGTGGLWCRVPRWLRSGDRE